MNVMVGKKTGASYAWDEMALRICDETHQTKLIWRDGLNLKINIHV